MNSDNLVHLREDSKETILEIETKFNEIQKTNSTAEALSYLQNIIDYLRKGYAIS